MKLNPLTLIDFYKSGHMKMYPSGTQLVYSNFTPRSARLGKVLPDFDDKIVFFGLQGFIKRFLIGLFNENFFDCPKEEVVSQYKRRMDTALGPGAVDVSHIEALWDLGYLPIKIKALPEGSRVNIGVPVLTIVNTKHEFYWLTNYLETLLSAELWKPCTTATIAYEYRRLLDEYCETTGAPKEFVFWQGHDFSLRGQSGVTDGASSGAGHLLSFYGTDTIPAIDYLEDYYFADAEKELIGGSVPASEHSVMSMGGQENEVETFRRLLKLYPSGIVSIVSDTWDFFKVITDYASELKDAIINRQPDALGNAKVVFRPDSGDPVKIICGEAYPVKSLDVVDVWDAEDLDHTHVFFKSHYYNNNKYYKIYGSNILKEVPPTPELKGAVQCLYEIFGGDKNEKGYITLNPRVGLIYGDSITLERAQAILSQLEAKGFSSANIVFGIGSYTYQYVTRDTLGFAMKATYGVVNGEGRELFKDPVTDNGTKKSAKGLLRVEKEGDDFVLYDQQTREQESQGVLETVFIDGKLVKETTLAEIRKRLHG